MRIIYISRRLLSSMSLLAVTLSLVITMKILGDNRQVAQWVNAGLNNTLPPVVYAGDERNNAVSLLFVADSSVDAECLRRHLEVLAANSARATFFISDTLAEEQADLVLAISAGGHQLGNYGLDGVDPNNLDQEQNRAALQETNRQIAEACGEQPLVYLAAYGAAGDEVRRAAADAGLMFVIGSIDAGSWSSSSPEDMLAAVLAEVRPGSFIVLSPDERTLQGLDTMLRELHGLGLGFYTVSDNIAWESAAQ